MRSNDWEIGIITIHFFHQNQSFDFKLYHLFGLRILQVLPTFLNKYL